MLAPRCGRDEAVIELLETSIFRRLFWEDVEGGAGDAFFRQCRINGVLVDDAAACAVNQADGRLHHFDLLGVNHIERLLVFGDVDGDVVGLFEDSFELVGYFDADFFGFRRDGERVVAEDFHIEALWRPFWRPPYRFCPAR